MLSANDKDSNNEQMPAVRDTLFISYATENKIEAKWLAIKLKTLGYKIWIDQFELLGGEDYVETIDKVISTNACKVIHLLSKYSRNKRNPKLERDRAIKVAERDGLEDFLIPLNLDEQKDLNWQISDTTFISFTRWDQGLSQLLARLERSKVPRTPIQRIEISRSLLMPSDVIVSTTERLFSNAFPFISVPQKIQTWKTTEDIEDGELRRLSLYWAFFKINNNIFISFDSPPNNSPFEAIACNIASYSWHDNPVIYNTCTNDIVQNLLHRSVVRKCAERGLVPVPFSRLNESSTTIREFYFPGGGRGSDTISFKFPNGDRGFVYRGGTTKEVVYRLGFSVSVRRNLGESFCAVFKIRPFILSHHNLPVPRQNIGAVRKKIAASWFNRDFVRRILAIVAFIGENSENIMIGNGREAVCLSSAPLQSEMNFSINDNVVEAYNKYISKE